MVSLRQWRYMAYAVGLFVIFQPSYIHPDEFFQSIEILVGRFTSAKATVPWEFNAQNASRSFAPLYLWYGPLYFVLLKIVRIRDPAVIIFVTRLYNYISYILVSSWAITLINNHGEVQKSLLLIATSYVTSVFQSHSFSNSLETLLLLVVLALFVKVLRSLQSNNYQISGLIGILISIGCFNRITFPGFIFLPFIKVLFQFYRRNIKSLIVICGSTLCSSCIFVLFDTYLYQTQTLTFAPLNNLLYNVKLSNLSEHGLHPRYTHLLVNLPQLLGPAVFLFPVYYRKIGSNIKSLPSLSVISGLVTLSLFQHQEARFLIPIVPLALLLCSKVNQNRKGFLMVWLIFNMVMGLIIGCFHQAGIIKVLNYYYREQQTRNNFGVHIWWKTYMPPTWMYMCDNLTTSTTNIVNGTELLDEIKFDITSQHVVDLKGADLELLDSALTNFLQRNDRVNLIAPASVKTRLMRYLNETSFKVTEDYHTFDHLDLDHFDVADLTTFIPGMSSYTVQNIL
ncbi:glycosylphosphatidylinositol-alpha 1,2 mannosyltransferase KNAG_0C04580 [Huiozyma naganishii CBS 8797]|uniref:Mannosyltransferase n=1 Tax=Huiozyma naganishii (strain ATCC MYA-139 / BCRC 22969 / CBS 8797 / KCTC 17520 / NBRC 10181 / NCYC 3082 / Yp74L-3) TaxID=1071383 RepID=J7R402_HUIN7|nr:hypothetical protein KNAG_0C04580 [Kazachstania naganishii CBS 8797]CCK69560.1 hypothetical protein KNAG_0C04580 [Kazachstania naganishii CBS 8797]